MGHRVEVVAPYCQNPPKLSPELGCQAQRANPPLELAGDARAQYCAK